MFHCTVRIKKMRRGGDYAEFQRNGHYKVECGARLMSFFLLLFVGFVFLGVSD